MSDELGGRCRSRSAHPPCGHGIYLVQDEHMSAELLTVIRIVRAYVGSEELALSLPPAVPCDRLLPSLGTSHISSLYH